MIQLKKAKCDDAEIIISIQKEDLKIYKYYETNPVNDSIELTKKLNPMTGHNWQF